MTNLSQILPRAIVPLAVGVGFALARKYVKPSATLSVTQLSELDSRFAQTRWIVGFALVAVGITFAWSSYHLLVVLNRYLAASDGPGTSFWLWPQSAIWWFFPSFGAITLCWDITLKLWSVFGDAGTASLYRRWSDGRAGFNATRILRWMALLIVAPIGLFTALALPMHSAVRDHDIRDCSYGWKGCKTFAYANAVRLTQIDGFRNRDGTLGRQPGFVLDFSDGGRWSSADIGDFVKEADPVLGAFLIERTHLPLNRAETEADIPKTTAGN